MGAAALGITAGISGGLSLGSGIMGFENAEDLKNSRLNALKLRLQEIKDSTTQTQIEQMTNLNHVLAAQQVDEAARGNMTPGVPNMVTIASINNFAQDINADKLNEIYQQRSVQSEEDAAVSQGDAQADSSLVSGIVGAGMNIADVSSVLMGGTKSGGFGGGINFGGPLPTYSQTSPLSLGFGVNMKDFPDFGDA